MDLKALYNEPHRRYHTWAHIEACLAELRRADWLTSEERDAVEQALLWHDAIYYPRKRQ